MNILDATNLTKPQHTRRHKNIDLVPARDHHAHDYEELEQAVSAGDKDKVFDLAKQLVEHNANKTDPLLTVGEIAMKLNRCTRSIWRMVANGELPEPILVGHSRRWFASDIANYLKGKRDGINRQSRN